MTTDNSNKTPANKQDLRLLMRLLPFIRPYKKMVMGAALALIITACVSLALGQGIRRLLIDQGFDSADPSRLNQAMLVLAIITFLMAAGTFTRFYLVSWLGERVSNDVRLAVFNHLLTLDPYYFEMNRSGEINARLTTDTTLLQSIIGSSISMALRNILTFVGGLVMMLITNPKLALIVLASVPLVIFPMMLYGRRVRKLSRLSQDRVADIGTYAGEIVQNIKVVQSFTREREETKAFGQEVEKAFNVAKKRILQRSILIVVAMTLVFTGLSSMIWVGAQDVANGHISSGELAAFVFYALMVAMAVATISEVYGELQRAAGATERLLELLAEQADISAPEDAVPLANGPLALSFDRVSFSYPSRPDQAALENISFNVSAGETVAIVGPSGAGKSTLFELLQRFYDPKNGNIKVSGHDIKQLKPQDLRSHLGLVPQQPTLFSADVAHNIRYGDPTARREEAWDRLEKAYADELRVDGAIFGRVKGGFTVGGQRQRIAIARAMLKNPSILLLDEATSALDANSEHQVQAALKEIGEGADPKILLTALENSVEGLSGFASGTAAEQKQMIDSLRRANKRLSELQFNH